MPKPLIVVEPTAQTLEGLIAATAPGPPPAGMDMTLQRVPSQCHARFFVAPVLVSPMPEAHMSVAEGALSWKGPATWEAGTPRGTGRSAASAQLVPFQWNAAGTAALLLLRSNPHGRGLIANAGCQHWV